MIPVSADARVWLVTGLTDVRNGYASLALIVQETLRRNPNGGHLFVFRGHRGDLAKILWPDGQGQCLFVKRLERGRFLWPSASSGAVAGIPQKSVDCCKTNTTSAPRCVTINSTQIAVPAARPGR